MVTVSYLGVQPNQPGVSAIALGAPPDTTQSQIEIAVLLTLGGSYVAGGDTISFANLSGLAAALPDGAPTSWTLTELAPLGTALTGYDFRYVYGPTLALPTQNGGGLQIFGAGAGSGQGGTQFTAGLYSNGTPSLNGVQIKATFKFAKS